MAQNQNPKTQNSLKREFHYYPFGMCFDVSKSPMLGKSAKHLKCMLKDYKDMEDCGDFLGDCEAAFSNYDAQIGRWLQSDPLMQHPSPYLAMSNNPVSFTDPLGLWDGNPILDRNGYPIAGLFSTDGAYYQVDWSLTVSNGHNVGSTTFYVSEMDEYNYKMKSLNKFFSPLYNQYYQTMYANGNLRRNGEAYGEVAANYQNNQLAWGMSLKEGLSKKTSDGVPVYLEVANTGTFGVALATGIAGESARGLTTTISNLAIEIKAAKIISKISVIAKNTGYVGNGIALGVNGVNFFNNPTTANFNRLAITSVAVSANLINLVAPGLGTFISISITAADGAGAFNSLYK
jgi:RHS repeat-associated protein